MPLTPIQIAAALDSIDERMGRAESAFEEMIETSKLEDWHKISLTWQLEIGYTQLMTLLEAIELPVLYQDVRRDYEKALKEGLDTRVHDPHGDPHLKWAVPLRKYVQSLQGVVATESSRTITKDLETILRGSTYSITDSRVFGAPPGNEQELHLRLECLLRTVFPDLKHKPSISKSIKNFQPDTGIPSIGTLIEYKFVSNLESVPKIADELLADSRGYISPEWTSFIYVIYETHRFKPEFEWRSLLRETGADSRATVVVITGESLPAKRRAKRLNWNH